MSEPGQKNFQELSSKENSHRRISLFIKFIVIGTILVGIFYNVLAPNQKVIVLSENPSIRLYTHLITPKEAEHLIKISKTRLQASTIQAGSKRIQVDDRTSSSAKLNKSEDPIVAAIEQRICDLLNCHVNQIEPLQIVHYTQGQQYKVHHDYFSPKERFHQTGQRIYTMLIYLNDLEPQDGGETVFPKLDLKIQPQLGTGLFFKNVDEQGNGDPLTYHAGAPVLKAGVEKWACNVWIRDNPY